jgi:hypothetical protein
MARIYKLDPSFTLDGTGVAAIRELASQPYEAKKNATGKP